LGKILDEGERRAGIHQLMVKECLPQQETPQSLEL
jgi:hypothetical protein